MIPVIVQKAGGWLGITDADQLAQASTMVLAGTILLACYFVLAVVLTVFAAAAKNR